MYSLDFQCIDVNQGQNVQVICILHSTLFLRLPRMEMGSTSVQSENEDVEERQLVRHRRRRMTSSSTDATNDVEGAEVNPPSSPPSDDNVHHSEQNGSVFPSEVTP